MIPKWNQFGCQMEPKWRQKGTQKAMFVLMFFRMPLETSIFLRRVRDGSATGPRVSRDCHTFSSRPPRAAAYYQRILYKNKQRQHSLEDLARLGPLARRILLIFTNVPYSAPLGQHSLLPTASPVASAAHCQCCCCCARASGVGILAASTPVASKRHGNAMDSPYNQDDTDLALSLRCHHSQQ